MFVDDPKNEDRSGDGKLHPSAISGCERNAIYSSRGEPVSNPRDVRFTRIMGNGTDYHIKLQAYLKATMPGIILEPAVRWGPITGHGDALLPVAPDGDEAWEYDLHGDWYELQEYKSISPNGKRYIAGTKTRTLKSGEVKLGREAAPKDEHVLQTRIYHYGLTKMGRRMTDTIRILYIDRDDWSTLEFEVAPWTEEEGSEYLEHMAELEAHLLDGTLPDQQPDDYWLCKMCAYRTTCKGWE